MSEDKINKLEINFAVMQNQMENIEKTLCSIESKLDNFFIEADKKYADKWVERFVWVALTAGVGSLVVALAKIVFK
jgi:hypothetical protein